MIHLPGSPRSAVEMLFVLEALPCPACGAHAAGELDYRGGPGGRGGQEGFIASPCPACGALRELHFHEPTDLFATTPEAFELGGAAPSTVLDAGELMAELDRVTLLEGGADRLAALSRALTCVTELAKFIPDGGDEMLAGAFRTERSRLDHALRPTRYRRDWLEARKKALFAAARQASAAQAATPHQEIDVTIGKLDAAALEAHLEWVRRGGDGPGRLALRGVKAAGVKVGAKDLSGAILVDVDLSRADLGYATVGSAQLEQVRLAGAGLASASLAGSRIVGCVFDGAAMTLCKLGDAVIEGCSFVDAQLDRSTWYRSTVARSTLRGARFGNAALDRAVFTDCDLRGAELALRAPQPLGSAFHTRFERCDLRDTTWAGRDCGGLALIDCKLGGARGKPGFLGGITLERVDVSAAGDGSRRLDGDAALAALGWA